MGRKRKRTTKFCDYCGQKYEVKFSELRKNRSTFCSQGCYHNSKFGGSSWNLGIPMRDDVKKRLSDKFMGEKNHQWRGGKCLWLEKIVKTFKYKQWRKAVYYRDSYECQECGIEGNGSNLNAHHILRVSEYPHLVFDVDNGITLCKVCHTKKHSHMMNRNKFLKSEAM